jgi:hypothetical protein
VPGEGQVGILAEVYDSKEFTGNFKWREEETAPGHLQNLTENLESPTFFRSIASKIVIFRDTSLGWMENR